jgi:hypothetical protein
MSNDTWTTRIGLLAAALVIQGCEPRDRPSTTDSAQSAWVMTESPGALATRHEAQDALDGARRAFERKDFNRAESELANAAAFLRTEAQEAHGEPREELRRAADVLDTVAVRIAKGQVRSVATLDRASLDVNTAEATFHLMRAKDALVRHDNVRAGEELVMCVDHLERGAKDARRQHDPAVQAVIADLRTLAREMIKGMGVVPDEVTKVSEEVESVINRLRAATPRVVSPVEAGALAPRHEAQGAFDRARAALLRRDFAASARELARASALIDTHAGEAELGAVAALQGAAKEIAVLAQRLERGEAQTPRNFDRVVANANRAEAQHHLTRADAARAKRDYRLAGEELLMSIDHLERAARDLGTGRTDREAAALAGARHVGVRLSRDEIAARADLGGVIAQLEAELRRVCAIIDREARACAMEPAPAAR